MTWSYSGDPKTTVKDRYRFYIGDTIESQPVLSDPEIEFILAEHGTHNYRMYKLFEALVIKFGREYKRSLGPQSEDPTSRLAFFEKQYERYKSVVESTYAVPFGHFTTNRTFYEGMHDNV